MFYLEGGGEDVMAAVQHDYFFNFLRDFTFTEYNQKPLIMLNFCQHISEHLELLYCTHGLGNIE